MDNMRDLKWFFNSVITLFAVWCLLSGRFDALHLGLGAVISFAIAAQFFRWRRKEGFPLIRFLSFVPWHLFQVLVSNLRVARVALNPLARIEPSFVRVDPGLADDRGLTLLGCGLTLTPGTLTVDIRRGGMLVHALDSASAKDVEAGAMSDKVRKVFGGK